MTAIIPRNDWCPIKPRRTPGKIAPHQPRKWLHHGAAGSSTVATAIGYVRYHIEHKGWADGGYSWIIAEGKVLELRGPGRAGAHTQGDNDSSYGICMAGNYTNRPPADRDLDALVWLLRHGMGRGWWDLPTLTGGHRDAPGATSTCPGTALHRHIPTINRRAIEGNARPPQEDILASIEDLERIVRDVVQADSRATRDMITQARDRTNEAIRLSEAVATLALNRRRFDLLLDPDPEAVTEAVADLRHDRAEVADIEARWQAEP